MADLRQVSRQTVHLAVLVDTAVTSVEIVRSLDAPRMPSEVGGRLPAHAAGFGKVLHPPSGFFHPFHGLFSWHDALTRKA